MTEIKGLKFTYKGGDGSGHHGHAGNPPNVGGSMPSSSLSLAGIESYTSAGGKALAEGRCTVEQMTKKEFASLFSGAGASMAVNTLSLGKRLGWGSEEVKRGKLVNDRAKRFASYANELHRDTLKKTYPDLNPHLISGAMIVDLNAGAAWELITGNLPKS